MKMGHKRFGLLLIPLLLAYVFVEASVRDLREVQSQDSSYKTLPSPEVASVISLGFNEAWADFLLLQIQVFTIERFNDGRMEDGKTLKLMCDLLFSQSPFHNDALQFCALALAGAWGTMGVSDAIDLLRKAHPRNPDNWRIPLNIGYLYYLHAEEKDQAIRWLRVALRYPETPKQVLWSIDSMATHDERSHLAGHMHAICSMCDQSVEKQQKKHLCLRCGFLKLLIEFEKLRARYEKEQAVPLKKIADFLERGYLKSLPPDPLGGQWIVDTDGRINSTANFIKGVKIEQEEITH